MLRLKEYRVEKGFSQKEFAELLDVPATNIYNYETGRTEPSLELLVKIATALNVSTDELLGRDSGEQIVSHCGHLTQNESEILKIFTTLDDAQQNRVIGFAYAFVQLKNA